MELEEFLNELNSGNVVQGGSEVHQFMHGVSQEALRITAEINGSYHEPAQLRALFSCRRHMLHLILKHCFFDFLII